MAERGLRVQDGGTIRRKIAAARAVAPPPPSRGVELVWPLALARGVRDACGLHLALREIRSGHVSPAELLEYVPEFGLVALLEGPGETVGLMTLAPGVMSGLIERQTLGRVLPQTAAPRRPTRTDAGLVAAAIDAALQALDSALADDPDRRWAAGFRYSGFLEDPRPLILMLEDTTHRVLRAEADLDGGAKSGPVLLALPAEGRGARQAAATPPDARAEAAGFVDALAERVDGAPAVLTAVVARLSMPLEAVLRLEPGMVLTLAPATLDRIDLDGPEGRRAAGGRLGQARGMRAIRLDSGEPAARAAPALPEAPPDAAALRAAAAG